MEGKNENKELLPLKVYPFTLKKRISHRRSNSLLEELTHPTGKRGKI